MRESKLFCTLPEEYVCTPDGMDIDSEGNLVLSCPNFAQEDMSGCVVKIDKDKNVSKWFDVPVHPETGVARNMGMALDGNDVYLCDNQGWRERPELLFKGRVLKVTVDDEGNILKSTVVAKNMEHPNGVRVHGDYMYVTQSYMHPVEREDGKLTSGVYRFGLNEEDIDVKNDLSDPHLFATMVTQNPECQYGADGIVFDKEGNLFVSNFGDGEVIKITFNEDGSLATQESYGQDVTQMRSVDGLCMDDDGNIYAADFSDNAIVMITPDREVIRIAESDDCTGLEGGIDQPGEPIVWNDRIIASCFDLVTGPDKVNTAHELPATLAEIPLR